MSPPADSVPGETPPADTAEEIPHSAIVRGVIFSLLSFAVFSCSDAMVKAIGGRLPIFEIAFFTTLFALFVLPFVRPEQERWRDLFRMRRPGLVLLIAGLLGIIAFTTLPFAEAYALIFLAPLFVTLLSIPLLGERIGWRRSLAVVGGFVGVLLVVRPGFRELLPGHFAALGVAVCAAITVLVLRTLGPTEKRITLMGVVIAVALTVNGVLMLFDFRVPTTREFVLLAVSGLCIGTGHVLFMAATRCAPANRVAPGQYSQMLWAILIGAIVFGEFPDGIAIAGIALIAVSGLFTFLREEKRGHPWPGIWTSVWGRIPRRGKA